MPCKSAFFVAAALFLLHTVAWGEANLAFISGTASPQATTTRTSPLPKDIQQAQPSVAAPDASRVTVSAVPEPVPADAGATLSPQPVRSQTKAASMPEPAPSDTATTSAPQGAPTSPEPISSDQGTAPAPVPPAADAHTTAPADPGSSQTESPSAANSEQSDSDGDAAQQADASDSDLWDRIRSGFGLPDSDSPLVARHENWYRRHPDYTERMMDRSKLYLYYIVEQVQKRGMPTEIALLPMIESAYVPTAVSRRKASGIWQFIPGTGKKYGLEQDWWYDGRRDVIEATQAALDYLQTLYNEFGTWELALAAYNCGEKKVARLLAYNKARGLPQDYQSLKKLPRETRNYIPKLIAIKNIVNDPKAFGLKLDEIPNEPYFTTVSAPSHIDVKVAARLADMPLDEFVSLNPAHIRPVIRGDSATLLLPVDKADTFNENLENRDKPLTSWQIYRAVRGEWLYKIAQRFGMTLERLKKVNGILPRSRVTSAGQILLVPADIEFSMRSSRKSLGSLHPLY